jgi:hypothetical protein
MDWRKTRHANITTYNCTLQWQTLPQISFWISFIGLLQDKQLLSRTLRFGYSGVRIVNGEWGVMWEEAVVAELKTFQHFPLCVCVCVGGDWGIKRKFRVRLVVLSRNTKPVPLDWESDTSLLATLLFPPGVEWTDSSSRVLLRVWDIPVVRSSDPGFVFCMRIFMVVLPPRKCWGSIFGDEGKIVLCFNWTPRHEGLLGKWMYSCTYYFDLGTRWRWVGSFTPWPLYPRGKSFWYPLDRSLGGPQSRSDSVVKRPQPFPSTFLSVHQFLSFYVSTVYEGVSKSFSDWPPGTRTANGTAVCH